jgi:glycosyltransferase involved in cell wall biosynthesis
MSRQLDILMVSSWDFQEHGMQAILRTPLHFTERGHKVTFLVHSELTSKPSRVQDLHPNIQVRRFDLPCKFLRAMPKLNRLRQLSLFTIYSLRALRRLYADGRKPDVIYAAECDAILLGSLLRRRYRVPFVCRYYGVSTILLEHPVKHLLYRLAITRPCDMAIVTDDGTSGGEVLRRMNPGIGMLKFWRNGIDPPHIDADKVATIRRRHQIDDSDFVLMTNSRLYGWKRVDRAIRVLARLVKITERSIKLLIVGHGPERAALESLAEELGVTGAVIFTGAVHHDHIYDYYSVADVLLSLYDMSNLGNPTWEAINVGRCVLALQCGYEDSVITHGQNGLLVTRSEDEETLAGDVAAAVKSLAEDPDLQQRLELGARQLGKEALWTWHERLDAEADAIEALVCETHGS